MLGSTRAEIFACLAFLGILSVARILALLPEMQPGSVFAKSSSKTPCRAAETSLGTSSLCWASCPPEPALLPLGAVPGQCAKRKPPSVGRRTQNLAGQHRKIPPDLSFSEFF